MIINAQIPDHFEKILGGNIDEVVSIYNQIETEQNVSSTHDLKEDFKSWFVSHSFINQSLIDKCCTTNLDGVTVCTTHLQHWILLLEILTWTFLHQPLKCILNFLCQIVNFTQLMRFLLIPWILLLAIMTLILIMLRLENSRACSRIRKIHEDSQLN